MTKDKEKMPPKDPYSREEILKKRTFRHALSILQKGPIGKSL